MQIEIAHSVSNFVLVTATNASYFRSFSNLKEYQIQKERD